MCEQLRDRVAIITGAGSGIGAGIAREFGRQKSTVLVADLNGHASQQTASEIQAEGGTAVARQVNVLDGEAFAQLVSETLQQFGRLDALVNVVGGSRRMTVEEMPEEEWDRVLDLNLKSAYLCARAVIPAMKRQGHGRIVNVASNFGATGAPGRADYSAAKAGIMGFTKALALELAPHGITVNALAPGLTETQRVRAQFTDEVWERTVATIPLGRAGRAEDMGPIVALLASDGGSYITGQTIHVNGGWVMP